MTVAPLEAPAAEDDIPQEGKVLFLAEDHPERLVDFVRSHIKKWPSIPVRIVHYVHSNVDKEMQVQHFGDMGDVVRVIPVGTYTEGVQTLLNALKNKESILVLDYHLVGDSQELTLKYLESAKRDAGDRIFAYSTVPFYEVLALKYAQPNHVLKPKYDGDAASIMFTSFSLEGDSTRSAVDFFGAHNAT